VRRAFVRARVVVLILILAALSAGCGSRGEPSPAADALIAEAADGEERQALTRARDDIDEEMREQAGALDEEIERLQKENETMRRRLAE